MLDLKGRILGALTATAAGDALGAVTETRPTAIIYEDFGGQVRDFMAPPDDCPAHGTPAGAVTDDFSLGWFAAEDLLDANGAGDTFNAAFLFALSHGWELRQCAEFATAAANLCITREGARSGVVPAEEVEAFWIAHGGKPALQY